MIQQIAAVEFICTEDNVSKDTCIYVYFDSLHLKQSCNLHDVHSSSCQRSK